MRSKDKTLLADIEKFVSNYTDRFGISPTMQEVADGVGSSKATVQRYIAQMCEDGSLSHERNLFCLTRQERFFHAFRGKIALNIGKYR